MIRRFQVLAVALIVALSVGSKATATPAPDMCVDIEWAIEYTMEVAE